jgi:hypothetical protein
MTDDPFLFHQEHSILTTLELHSKDLSLSSRSPCLALPRLLMDLVWYRIVITLEHHQPFLSALKDPFATLFRLVMVSVQHPIVMTQSFPFSL